MKNIFLSVIFALGVLVTARSQADGNPIINRDGMPIDYSDCGKGGITLLFVHGWNINKEYWQAQLDHFCPKYRVVAIDLPGFRQPEAKREAWTVEAFGEDVIQTMETLDLKKVILIGHSMGGDIILEAALKASDRVIGLIGIDNFKDPRTSYSPEEEEGLKQFLAALRADYPNVVEAGAEAQLFHPDTDPVVKKRVLDDFKSVRPEVAIGSIELLIYYAKKETEQLQRLDNKLYLVNSDYTPTDEEALTKYCGAGFEIIPIHATGHFPMIEKPAEFNQKLEVAIDKVLDNEK
ncbi:MAG: alpha/beta hydrolase [Phaeodactylibacter sp.]|nr:alpha/beta hydrolase [Phaeodactylibacter sp.]